ncbi:hypothetical protein HYG86_15170 [Alkalicella caledoniensis]|uniref:Uncharacterized protein n=1 Tax=Alkalicella caledoniensis TaxID=2731377 RepID=A0A7G9WBF0_ALKCA|nr:hypothetical protein [Alkalicella caledoniensis]QNO16012.1 hypothetical protein HYG86_15170 [Alkalicella caledoniensis]
MADFLENSEGKILAIFLLVIMISLALYFIKGTKYEKQAKILIVTGTVIWFTALIFKINFLLIAGHIIMNLGIVAGVYGGQSKISSPIPMYVFMGSYLAIQGIGYGLDYKVLQSLVITETSKSYEILGLSTIIPMILSIGSYYLIKKHK